MLTRLGGVSFFVRIPPFPIPGLLATFLAADLPRAQPGATCAHLVPAPSVRVLARQPPSLVRATALQALRCDPALALASYRALLLQARHRPELLLPARLGLAKSWLLAGRPRLALCYADDLITNHPAAPEGWAMRVRALLLKGDFRAALAAGRAAERRIGLDHPDLRAAHAAALFRNRRLPEAERGYRHVLASEPLHVEALIRLGTGLLPPRAAGVPERLRAAVSLQRAGHLQAARLELVSVLGAHPEHPMAMRVLGELMLSIDRGKSPLVADGFFGRLWQDLDPTPELPAGLCSFFEDHDELGETRRRMIAWSARPFARHLRHVARKGGRHDMLMEYERTTDDASRAWLRGRRTFDGRVWDDVRGIGGLCAATGVECLDDAVSGGFQTLVHELAHQVHFYSLPVAQQRRIAELYRRATRHGRALDYYAESNESEYFAQGVEAYFSLAKSPGQPITHGHTRFELMRKDPDLHAFLRTIVEVDPLRDGDDGLLQRLFAAALRVGRVKDARTILGMMSVGTANQEHGRRLARAEMHFLTL